MKGGNIFCFSKLQEFVFPGSPWLSSTEKQALEEKNPSIHHELSHINWSRFPLGLTGSVIYLPQPPHFCLTQVSFLTSAGFRLHLIMSHHEQLLHIQRLHEREIKFITGAVSPSQRKGKVGVKSFQALLSDFSFNPKRQRFSWKNLTKPNISSLTFRSIFSSGGRKKNLLILAMRCLAHSQPFWLLP